tara:strand:- start:194 stop:337 length:144 start_codon:yes stop_codon:yes gene_type:complete
MKNVLPITKLKKERTQQLIAELYWDEERLSQSGKQTLEKLAHIWDVR